MEEEEVDKLREARKRQAEIIVAGSDIISLFPNITVSRTGGAAVL